MPTWKAFGLTVPAAFFDAVYPVFDWTVRALHEVDYHVAEYRA